MAPLVPSPMQADGASGTMLSKGHSTAGNMDLALSPGRNDAPVW